MTYAEIVLSYYNFNNKDEYKIIYDELSFNIIRNNEKIIEYISIFNDISNLIKNYSKSLKADKIESIYTLNKYRNYKQQYKTLYFNKPKIYNSKCIPTEIDYFFIKTPFTKTKRIYYFLVNGFNKFIIFILHNNYKYKQYEQHKQHKTINEQYKTIYMHNLIFIENKYELIYHSKYFYLINN
jgi:hypothetical protein